MKIFLKLKIISLNIFNYFYKTITLSYLLNYRYFKAKSFYKNIDFNSIYKSCILSEIAYLTPNQIIESLNKNGFNSYTLKIYDNEKKSSQAFLIYKDNIGYLTFRGSDSTIDIIYDLNNELIDISFDFNNSNKENILVHKGFLIETKSLLENIENDLNILNLNILYLQGHSLGASQVTIASLYIQNNFPNTKIILNVFGSPRCGNNGFVELFKDKIKDYYRIVFESDPVNEYPPSKQFYHIGNCLTFKESGVVRLSQKDTPINKRIIITLLNFNILDHSLTNYIKAFKNI